MQFKATVAALALAAVSGVAAQDLSSLPECALQPAIAAVGSTGCSATDIKCVCEDKNFLASLTPAIQKSCSPSDFAKAGQAAISICKAVGVDLSLPSGPSPSTPASPPTTAPGPVSVTTTAAVTTTVVASGTGTGLPGPTANGTLATPTPTATIVPGAAANVGVQSGLLALAGAAAMFFAL